MTVELKWVPTWEASDHRKKGWVEVNLYDGLVVPDHFLMASPVEEEFIPTPSVYPPAETGMSIKFQPEPAAPIHRVTEQGRVEVNKGVLFASPAVQEVCEIAGRIVDLSNKQPNPAAPVVYVCPNCNQRTERKQEHEIDAAIVAVRAQATEARVKLPKVREFLTMFNDNPEGFFCPDRDNLREMHAELDAAEGKAEPKEWT